MTGRTDPDAELIALAGDLHAAHLHYAAMCRTDDDDAINAASDSIEAHLARMADIPAASLTGAAAKMGRLCLSLSAREGRSLWYAEYPLVDSLADDLARMVPGVVPSLPAPPPLPPLAAAPMPETEWQRTAREGGERLAALGLARDAGFTVADVQLVGWLLGRIASEMGAAAADRVRDLCAMDETSLRVLAAIRACDAPVTGAMA